MKKINREGTKRITSKRCRKTLKRRRKGKKFNESRHFKQLQHQFREVAQKQRKATRTGLDKFLEEKGFIDTYLIAQERLTDQYIRMPADSRLQQNYLQVIGVLSEFYSSLHANTGKVTLSFAKCTKLSLATFLLIKTFIVNFYKQKNRCEAVHGAQFQRFPTLDVIKSPSTEINALLSTLGFSDENETGKRKKDDMNPVYYLPFTRGGARKSYHENSKGSTCKKIIRFINDSIIRRGFGLTKNGANRLDRLVSEILNNAEDHNYFKEWYLMGTLFETSEEKAEDVVGRLDLVFLNYGFSIYEGFELTKANNGHIYNEMQLLYSLVQERNSPAQLANITREGIFTLAALQEGVSRLKYKRESRGTGTVNFINAFMELGGYLDAAKGFQPELTIFSGHTMIKCDTQHKPVLNEENIFVMSLNAENDLTKAPSKKHLVHLHQHFPGTLLSVTIYLSSEHFEQIIKRNEGASTSNGTKSN